jgi:hypothetical protein
VATIKGPLSDDEKAISPWRNITVFRLCLGIFERDEETHSIRTHSIHQKGTDGQVEEVFTKALRVKDRYGRRRFNSGRNNRIDSQQPEEG